MRRYGILILFCITATLIIPLIVYGIMLIKDGNKNDDTYSAGQTDIRVYFHEENEVRTMNVEEYLCGVVSAEMPASFELEALKAQAVAARSYAMYKKRNPDKAHQGADVCTDHTHCKAYKSEEEQKKSSETDREKIQEAVYSTCGEVITYNGEVAMAVFHSQAGGGRTENSEDVWGGNIPYLVSVESHGEEFAPDFYSEAEVTFDEFCRITKNEFPDIAINSHSDIGKPVISEGGSVRYIAIGNKEISGRDIRRLFNLRSSCFSLNIADNNIVFKVTGYGHGVGMSQYGANAMAKEGYDYKKILMHYYSGTKVEGV